MLIANKRWPCYFSVSDTTGEKPCEEFFTATETVDHMRFDNIGVVQNAHGKSPDSLKHFIAEIDRLSQAGSWNKRQIVELFGQMIPDFGHIETGRHLDQKM